MRRLCSVVLAALFLAVTACGSADATSAPPAVNADCPVPESERAYVYGLATDLASLFDLLGRLFVSIQTTRANPNLVLEETWKGEVSDVLAAMAALAEHLRTLDPPPTVSHLQVQPLSVASGIEGVIPVLTEGIERLGEDKLSEAASQLGAVERDLQQSWGIVDGYCNRHFSK